MSDFKKIILILREIYSIKFNFGLPTFKAKDTQVEKPQKLLQQPALVHKIYKNRQHYK